MDMQLIPKNSPKNSNRVFMRFEPARNSEKCYPRKPVHRVRNRAYPVLLICGPIRSSFVQDYLYVPSPKL
jgi:hypothetical protein